MFSAQDILTLRASGLPLDEIERLVRAGTPQFVSYNNAQGGGATITNIVGSSVGANGGENNMTAVGSGHAALHKPAPRPVEHPVSRIERPQPKYIAPPRAGTLIIPDRRESHAPRADKDEDIDG